MRSRASENSLNDAQPPSDLVMVCGSLKRGGTERVASTLANAWSRQGRRVSVISLQDADDVFHLDPPIRHIVVHQVTDTSAAFRFQRSVWSLLVKTWGVLNLLGPSRLFEKLFRSRIYLLIFYEALCLRRVIQQTNAPVVMALGTAANALTILACRKLGRKVIISERNDPARQVLPYPWNRLRLRLYNQADLVTANTRDALKAMQAYVDKQKLAFVPNPLVFNRTNAHVGKAPTCEAPFVLIVARLHPQKAHDVLLSAFARLSPDLATWRLAIVGVGEREEELQEQAAVLGIADRTDWHGLVADPFVFYRGAKMFVLPSRYEGTPNALLETMSCGLPVIVSDAVSGLHGVVTDTETGLLVPVDDPAALAWAMEELARDAALRQRLGEAGRRRVAAYDVSNVLPIWERIIGL